MRGRMCGSTRKRIRPIERGVRVGRSLAPASVALLAALLVAGCSDDAGERRRALGPHSGFGDLMRVADAGRGGRLFGQCAACHTAGQGAGDRNGPGLYGVMGQPVAGNSRRFGYTGALRAAGGVWTPERMDAWLAAPAALVPGTSMRFGGIPDALDRADIVAYLQTLSERPEDGAGR